MAKRTKQANKKGRKADRARISGKQTYEVAYVARKFGVSAAVVRAAIKKVGNMRAKVYAELEKST
jgi:Zn-dependent peptidase ImmA (M78 family)